MCDECTWRHKTFLVKLFWHLAIKLYCIKTYNSSACSTCLAFSAGGNVKAPLLPCKKRARPRRRSTTLPNCAGPFWGREGTWDASPSTRTALPKSSGSVDVLHVQLYPWCVCVVLCCVFLCVFVFVCLCVFARMCRVCLISPFLLFFGRVKLTDYR